MDFPDTERWIDIAVEKIQEWYLVFSESEWTPAFLSLGILCVCYIIISLIGIFSNAPKTKRRTIVRSYKTLKNHAYQEHVRDPKKAAGVEGENWLKYFISMNKQFKKAVLFSSKRIMDTSVSHKREIDIIAVTRKKIYIIECKNWAGEIVQFSETAGTIRYKPKPMAPAEEQRNPVRENAYKVNLLRNYLNSQLTIELSIKDFVNKIIFINERMKYPESLKECQNVITSDQLTDYLSSERTGYNWAWGKSLITAIFTFLESEESASRFVVEAFNDLPHYKTIISIIDDLPTWDWITMRDKEGNEFTYNGDILYYQDVFLGFADFQKIRDITIVTQSISVITLLFNLINRKALVYAKVNYIDNRPEKMIPINPSGTLLFQPAGDKTRKNVSILDVTSISVGFFKKKT
jgi:hypothetical protein